LGSAGNSYDDLRSSSEADMGRTELDQTLTFPKDEGQVEEVGQGVGLEDTVVVEENNDWLMVTSKPSEEGVTTSKQSPPVAHKPIREPGGLTKSAPITSKPLPSPPSRRVKEPPVPIQTLGMGSESKAESSANKVSPPPSPLTPASRHPPPVSMERESGGREIKSNAITPSESPVIRISPSSFSRTIPGKGEVGGRGRCEGRLKGGGVEGGRGGGGGGEAEGEVEKGGRGRVLGMGAWFSCWGAGACGQLRLVGQTKC
jgi:hypothetical protein